MVVKPCRFYSAGVTVISGGNNLGQTVGCVCRKYAALIRKRLSGALPTILVQIAQFLTVFLLFGTEYAMTVGGATTLFQVRRARYNTLGDCLKMFCVSLLLCVLALLATRNLVLCVLLNFTVPFALVYLQSSQFVPKGHFAYAMIFVFLELRPPAVEHFGRQILAAGACTLITIAALLIYGRWVQRPKAPGQQAKDALLRLSRLLRELAEGRDGAAVQQELVQLSQEFQRQACRKGRFFSPQDPRRRFVSLFALLLQRAVYLISDVSWREQHHLPVCQEALLTLSGMAERACAAKDPAVREELAAQARELLSRSDLPQGRVRIFYRSVLHMALLLLQPGGEAGQSGRSARRLPTWGQLRTQFRRAFSLERFEVRFALRLAVVVTVSSTVSLAWDFEHTYWFPLHAFLLLQPSYEESTHRMFTRPIGTAIGCLLVHLVLPWLPGTAGIFVFSLCMISLMFCCTPGTWVQPIFSTSFALTMATLTVREEEAIQLRLFYLVLAIVLVLLVNRFLFPTRREQQFQRNVRALLRMQGRYWEQIRRSLREPIPADLAGQMLSSYHMVYHEAVQFVQQLPPEEDDRYRPVFLTLWNMFSELEQILCLILARLVPQSEYEALDRLAEQMQARFDPPRSDLTGLPQESEAAGELSYVINRYLANAQALAGASDLLREAGVN